MAIKTILSITVLLVVFCFLTLFISAPALAERSLEWRSDGLWVIDDDLGEFSFDPLNESFVAWLPKAAALSPDNEWVAFARHTGGGFENEGMSCFAARWDGTDERLILDSDWLIPDVYWMEGEGSEFIAVQQTSGGTAYGSHFKVVDFDSGDVVAHVIGHIYGVSYGGTRFQPENWHSSVGLRYEVLGGNEEPIRWGVFYIDELIDFGTCPEILSVDGIDPEGHPLTDGRATTAWTATSSDQPSFTLSFEEGVQVSGISIIAGWSWHENPAETDRFWGPMDWFHEYERPRELLVTYADGGTTGVELMDARFPQWIWVPEDADTSSIEITILSAYGGSTFDQVAVSEVYIQ